VVFLEFVAGMSFFGIYGCFSEERETNVRKMHENGGKLLSFFGKNDQKLNFGPKMLKSNQSGQNVKGVQMLKKMTKRTKSDQKRPKS
jgi:hypothetical protein